MVTGLDTFRRHFRGCEQHYVVIGGTACDMLLSNEGLTMRTTKDIDIVLIAERMSADFVDRLWGFLKLGRYQSLEKDAAERKYYRFSKPEARADIA